MAKATLPTNYRDDILNASTEGKRKYRMNYNDDGTVSFVDVTPYDQEGSDFGAGDINATNEAVNQSFDKSKLIRDMDAINALTQEGYAPDALALKEVNESLGGLQFGVDENGNYGYIKAGADSVTPFKSGDDYIYGSKYSEEKNIVAGHIGTYNMTIYTAVKVDISSYSKIKSCVGAYAYHVYVDVGLCITDALPTTIENCRKVKYTEHPIKALATTSYEDLELDVSEYSGEYYICYYQYSGSNTNQSIDWQNSYIKFE